MSTPTRLYRNIMAAANQYNEQLTKQHYGTKSPQASYRSQFSSTELSESSSFYEVAASYLIHKNQPAQPKPAYFQQNYQSRRAPRHDRSRASTLTSFHGSIRALEMRSKRVPFTHFPAQISYNQRVLMGFVAHTSSFHGLFYIGFAVLWALSVSTVATYPLFFVLDKSVLTVAGMSYLYGFNWLFMPVSVICATFIVIASEKKVKTVAIKRAYKWVEASKLNQLKSADLEKGTVKSNYSKYTRYANVKYMDLKPVHYRLPVIKHFTQTEEDFLSIKGALNYPKILRHAVCFVASQTPLVYAIWILASANIGSIWAYQLLTQTVTIALSVPAMLWIIDVKVPHRC